MNRIPLKRGDPLQLSVSLTENGTLLELATGDSLWFTMKQFPKTQADNDASAIQKTYLAGVATGITLQSLNAVSGNYASANVDVPGAATVSLSDNADFYADLQHKKAGETEVFTVWEGIVSVTVDVTRAT